MQALQRTIITALLITILSSGSVFANGVDPILVKALHHATVDKNLQTKDLQELRWLSSMSDKLERQIRDPFYRVRLLKTIFQEANNVGLDPQLVLAVIDTESSFNRYAVSSAGAQGLMQVMPFWKDVLDRPDADLLNPLTSIQLGCEILRRYMDRHTDIEDALAAYNGSLGRSKYPDKVLHQYQVRWQYEEDSYAPDNEIKVAVTDRPFLMAKKVDGQIVY